MKLFFTSKVRKVVYTFTRSILVHTKQITDSVCHCLVRARIVFLKSLLLARTKQWNANVEVFVALCKCVCGAHITRFRLCSHISYNSNTLRPPRSERHLHFEQGQNRSEFINISDRNRFAITELERHCLENSRDDQNKRAFNNKYLSLSDFIR